MQITKELVTYVAELSRIKLDAEETEKMKDELGAVIAYMDVLNTLDTTEIEPLSHVFSINNVMREDRVAESYPRSEIMKNVPEVEDSMPVVPKTVD